MKERDASIERLTRSLQGVGARASRGAAVELFEELETRYAETHRAYHTLAHVQSCLAFFDGHRAQARRPAEVELALWSHDAVYDPARADNEARSAALACSRLRTLGVPHDASRRVSGLIVETAAHRASEGDAALVCAIDLSVLGAAWEAFDAYQAAVRMEYRHVADAVFAVGRASFLRALVQREVIYANRAIREQLEVPARRNIQRALAEGRASAGRAGTFSASKVP